MAFTGSAAAEKSRITVTDPVRVMVVDDSVVVRGLIGRWLDDRTYYKLEVDGSVIYEIDIINSIRVIDGVDQLAKMREQLGI